MQEVLDRVADMKLDLRSLLAGEIREQEVAFSLTPDVALNDPKSSLYGVMFKSPVAVSGRIVNTAGYITMSLEMHSAYRVPCARCLTEVEGEFSLSVERVVVTPREAADMDEREDDYVVTEDGFLYADELLAELFECNFPVKVLCREDCRGLCPRCGTDLNEGSCHCDEKPTDSRFAVLGPLLERLRAEEAAERENEEEQKNK